jgi:tetratricopeptide (TPR) repeat protein
LLLRLWNWYILHFFHSGAWWHSDSLPHQISGQAQELLAQLKETEEDLRLEEMMVLWGSWWIARIAKAPHQPEFFCEKAIALAQEIGDRWWEASFKETLGYFEPRRRKARELLRTALSIWRELGDRQGVISTLVSLCIRAWRIGRFEECLEYCQELGELTAGRTPNVRFAEALIRMGNFAEGRTMLEQALLDPTQLTGYLAYTMFLAEADIHLGWSEAGIASLRKILTTCERHPYPWMVGFLNYVMGLALLGKNQPQKARTRLTKAVDILRQMEEYDNLGWSMALLALAEIQLGNTDHAQECLVEALELWQ